MGRKDEYEWIVAPSGETVVIKGNSAEKLRRACEKELRYVSGKEAEMQKKAMKELPVLKRKLDGRIPTKVRNGLCSAFCIAFETVFQKGSSVIGKTFDQNDTIKEHLINDYAVRLKGDRKKLKQLRRNAGKSDVINSAVPAAEGVGFGLLGIGIPDLVLFISVILKGIYEKAAFYGHDYLDPRERYFILKAIEASLSHGEDWVRCNGETDNILTDPYVPDEAELKEQIKKTADVCALDMLANKFIQGIPLVGTIGGLSNPLYYGKILSYVKLKYHKRYVLGLISSSKD